MLSVRSRLLTPALCLVLLATACGTSHEADWSADEPLGTVADLGFRPEHDGYQFANFTHVYNANLSEEDVKDLLGPLACEEPEAAAACTLTRGAAAFQSANQDLARDGVCEGLSVTSLLFYDGHLDPQDFGAETVHNLTVDDNPALEREIRKWNATHLTKETQRSLIRGDPREIFDKLARAFRGGDEHYSVGLYNRVDGELAQGHAVVPYRIDHVGDGVVELAVYNSNFPGEETSIMVDATDGTWTYEGANILYDGSAPLEIAPVSARDVDHFDSTHLDVDQADGCNVRGISVE